MGEHNIWWSHETCDDSHFEQNFVIRYIKTAWRIIGTESEFVRFETVNSDIRLCKTLLIWCQKTLN